jgi:hypothetical protein
LRQAVEEFIKKEYKVEDFEVLVEEELDKKKSEKTIQDKMLEEIEDALFAIKVNVNCKIKAAENNNESQSS